MRLVFAFGLASMLVSAATTPGHAAWPTDPVVGVPVCVEAQKQSEHEVLTDGSGGAFVVWRDERAWPQKDIFAHHLLSSGVLDPAWRSTGVPVCTDAADQLSPQIVSDGAGGMFVGWQDQRLGYRAFFVQHVLATGTWDPLWPVNGVALFPDTAATMIPNAGAVIVAWSEKRNGVDFDVYAHRVLASGELDPAWPAGGRALCTAPGDQGVDQGLEGGTYFGEVLPAPGVFGVSDEAGGAIITWNDKRTGIHDIYAQRVLTSGVLAPGWPGGGRRLDLNSGGDRVASIISDGTGGAIVTWLGYGGTSTRVFTQHALVSGVIDPAWPAGGILVCGAGRSRGDVQSTRDGFGGAFVTWRDSRNPNNHNIYAQRVLSSGTVDPSWTVNGVPVCSAIGNEFNAKPFPDVSGGLIVSWADPQVSGGYDLYAQHMLASGISDPVWPVNGRAVATAYGSQVLPRLVSGGTDAVVIVWSDERSGPSSDDLYAERVARHGFLGAPEPAITSVLDVPADQGLVVNVTWDATYLESAPYGIVTYYKVLRSAPPANVWEEVATINADGSSSYAYAASTPGDGIVTTFRIQAWTADGLFWDSEPASGSSTDDRTVSVGDGRSGALWFAASPNPARNLAVLSYGLPRAGKVRVAIYDAAGRLVRDLASGAREAGEHAVRWDLCDAAGRVCGSGLYFARIETASGSLVRRVAVTP